MKVTLKVPHISGIFFKHKNGHAFIRKKNSLRTHVIRLSEELKAENRIRTARAYIGTLNCVLRFTDTDDISLGEISENFVKDLETFLKMRGCRLNTISFYMRNLRAIYNKAIDKELLHAPEKNPFLKVFTGNAQTSKRALSKSEITLIKNWKNDEADKRSKDALLHAKLYFLFSFYTRGMSFIDMAYLKKEDVNNNVICYARKKTGQTIHVQITPDLKKIIRFFEQETSDSIYLLPIITKPDKPERTQYESALRTYNNNLKKIRSMTGINKALTGYVARHSWATIAKYMQVPIEQISESLGHSNIKTTMIYLAAFDQSILHRVNMKVTV